MAIELNINKDELYKSEKPKLFGKEAVAVDGNAHALLTVIVSVKLLFELRMLLVTGKHGSLHIRGSLDYGTKVVGGINPNIAGSEHLTIYTEEAAPECAESVPDVPVD